MEDNTKIILSKLESLRENINENADLMIMQYDILNKKDHWSCLCSAMDWIDVAKEHIDSCVIKNDNFKLLWSSLYTYLSAVDIIIDSISQIYRGVYKDHKQLLNNDSTIFLNKYLKMDDYSYFKHIRAVFGAHSVKISEDGVYKFASWPHYEHGGIYSVIVYSSEKNADFQQFQFNINDIDRMLLKYVNCLDNIYLEIKKSTRTYIESKKMTQ